MKERRFERPSSPPFKSAAAVVSAGEEGAREGEERMWGLKLGSVFGEEGAGFDKKEGGDVIICVYIYILGKIAIIYPLAFS